MPMTVDCRDCSYPFVCMELTLAKTIQTFTVQTLQGISPGDLVVLIRLFS